MQLITAPNKIPTTSTGPRVFLAGSIENGGAVDWQVAMTEALSDLDIVILNPRRADWDKTWQDLSNPQFVEQVNWELDALEAADLIVMYFDPATKSPISLLEFGKYYESRKLIVACPDGFWRRGNIQVCCSRAQIPVLESLEQLIETTRVRVWMEQGNAR